MGLIKFSKNCQFCILPLISCETNMRLHWIIMQNIALLELNTIPTIPV